MDDYDDNAEVEDEIEDTVNINKTNKEEMVELVDDSVFCIRIDMHPIDQNIIVSGGGHVETVQSVLFSKDGQYIASGGMDVPSGNCMNVFSEHENPVTAGAREDARFHKEGITSLAINKESALVLTGSTDSSAILVNLSNGAILGSFEIIHQLKQLVFVMSSLYLLQVL
ncbi:WD40 repeat-like protein [Gigaspora margarita]|uniref:WD40 repeat-like protein n=1 Tax=Gigaspora margarita TaxID=4874 RepID=A0A8H3XJQ3_GIGMA|nr:WD40 repeat-like protein [Gigaspora margarita]